VGKGELVHDANNILGLVFFELLFLAFRIMFAVRSFYNSIAAILLPGLQHSAALGTHTRSASVSRHCCFGKFTAWNSCMQDSQNVHIFDVCFLWVSIQTGRMFAAICHDSA